MSDDTYEMIHGNGLNQSFTNEMRKTKGWSSRAERILTNYGEMKKSDESGGDIDERKTAAQELQIKLISKTESISARIRCEISANNVKVRLG